MDRIEEFLQRVARGEDTTADDIDVSCTNVLRQSSTPPMPPVKPPKKEKIKRIYEDDTFVIDLINDEESTLRVSIFKDNHFQDEVFINSTIVEIQKGK